MFGMTALQVAVASAALVAGAAAGTAVVVKSGPFTGSDPAVTGDQANLPATAAASQVPPVMDAEASPRVPYQSDYLIQPGELVDFSRLPVVQSSSWKTVAGSHGMITVRVPADWETIVQEVTYNQGGTGDSLALFEPTSINADAGVSIPGWVKVDLAIHPFKVPLGMGDGLVQTIQLPPTSTGLSLTAYQFGQSTQFVDNRGSVVIVPTGGTPAHVLSGAAYVWLPATAGDIANAIAVLESVEVR